MLYNLSSACVDEWRGDDNFSLLHMCKLECNWNAGCNSDWCEALVDTKDPAAGWAGLELGTIFGKNKRSA